MNNKLVIANWKMNGSRSANVQLLSALLPAISDFSGVDVAICPPYPYLAQVAQLLENTSVDLGAQNVCQIETGAYTGEVSTAMLQDLGCRFVLIGHSERRALFGESDSLIAEKFEVALKANLAPVLCVGETLEQRRNGVTQAVVTRQLQAVLQRIGIEGLACGVIAYEPVWAIGTGETASPEQAQEVHQFIRSMLAEFDSLAAGSISILYGGSVKADNAQELFAQQDIDGGLIGGASLDAVSFAAICKAAHR